MSGLEREGDPDWAVMHAVLTQLESLGIISG